ncbi:hypothetical protein [Paenibacillus sp. NPDC057934]|uniref:hypothetical protein n=1 Tax=Paenibacillus sp. NPDC057934 TaxID=3346282 RepID=UPI0036D9C9FD
MEGKIGTVGAKRSSLFPDFNRFKRLIRRNLGTTTTESPSFTVATPILMLVAKFNI